MIPVLVSVSVLAVILAFGVYFGITAVQRWGVPTLKAGLEAYWSDRWETVEERLDVLERHVDTLPQIWEDFAVDAKKRQERARWHVRRVKKELEKHGLADPEIETLDSDLRPAHGGGGDEGELPLLSDAMAQNTPEPEEDPVTRTLRHKWGRM